MILPMRLKQVTMSLLRISKLDLTGDRWIAILYCRFAPDFLLHQH